MRFITTDLKRIFTEPAFFLSLLLGTLLLFGAMGYLMISGGVESGLYVRSQALALPFVAPLLAAMPYSVMIMRENETRYSILMTVKLRKSGYKLPRLLTCGISGAAALFIPHLALFIVCDAIEGTPDFKSMWELVLPLTFGFGYGAFSYGLTFANRQRYVPLVMPQVLYMLCIYAFPYIHLERFYPPLDISPSIFGGHITWERFAVPAALTAAALVLTAAGAIKAKVGENV